MKILFLILFIGIFASCDKQDGTFTAKNENDTIVVYDRIRYNMMRIDKINNGRLKLIDTACINGEKRAKIEAYMGIYTYYYGAGFGFHESQMKYLKNAFSAKGIRIDFYYVSCMGTPLDGEFGRHCYVKAAKAEFEKKYGKTRIDSMGKASEELIKKYYNK